MTPHRSDGLRKKAFFAVKLALGDAYDCHRVWDAWNEGTMTEDDFSSIDGDHDRVMEIADAALDAVEFAALLEERDALCKERDMLREKMARATKWIEERS